MELFTEVGELKRKRRMSAMPDPYRPSSPRPTFDSLINQIQSLTSTIDKLEKRIAELDREVREGGYINRNEFNAALATKVDKEGRYWLVEKLVFGWVVMVLAAVAGALLLTVGLRS